MISSIGANQLVAELQSIITNAQKWKEIFDVNYEDEKANLILGIHLINLSIEENSEEHQRFQEVMVRFIGELKLTASKCEALARILGNE